MVPHFQSSRQTSSCPSGHRSRYQGRLSQAGSPEERYHRQGRGILRATYIYRQGRERTLRALLEGYRHREDREEGRYTGGLAKPPFSPT